MASVRKIKILDDDSLRNQIDELLEEVDQSIGARWSVSLARRIIKIIGFTPTELALIEEGFKVNEAWQNGKARMHDVRQAGFKIHKLARAQNSEEKLLALRVVGQAVASGHMKEHAIVASDYAIKFIGLINDGNMTPIRTERQWQLSELVRITKS